MAHISEEILQEYLAGRLSSQQELEVIEHIAGCNNCAERLADKMTETMLVSPPPDLKKDILEQTVYQKSPVLALQEIQERKRAKKREFLAYSAKVVFAMAASILMIISMSSNFGERKDAEVPTEIIQVEQEVPHNKKNIVSGSLKKASGKAGDALSAFLGLFEKQEEEERK